ncbi:PREDICTED: endogenous retrovirus group K member 18 Pol protein-like [Pseudopodoces humilis]|uniref:endogenous retrovirus group K member 18 Pol protein-like n=1 Tax=Pseudopodoces humilis TaxID=181119 RepID=UPI0006B7D6A0|nr:PREDICTED: endogenous retrovirus group K member 18 Pol protein-like [Pseudopodoces humilis]
MVGSGPTSKYIAIGDTKHTPPEIEISPIAFPGGPENLILLARCTHPPFFLAKGQIIAQFIPIPEGVPVDDHAPWPLRKDKLKALNELVEEQLAKGNTVETTSPWNSPVFVIRTPGKDKWRLLHDLPEINKVIVDMGPLQPGMPTPTMLPQNWKLAVIDIKDCFFQIPLHPDDAPWFAFSVPTLNREAPMRRFHWRVLPQRMKNSPSICQWYVSSLLSPVRAKVGEVIIHHYMNDVLVCAPHDNLLKCALDLLVEVLTSAGFQLQEEKVQRMPPWKYLGLQIA